jgi:predicted nucleic acid-binding Zn ribbon protein
MPLRDYVCKNQNCEARGRNQERLVKMNDPEAQSCEICHEKMEPVTEIGATSFALKGQGWFRSGGYAVLALVTGLATACASTSEITEVHAREYPGEVSVTDKDVKLEGLGDRTTAIMGRGHSGVGILGVLRPIGQMRCATGSFSEGDRVLDAEATRVESLDADIVAYVFDSIGLLDLASIASLSHRCGPDRFDLAPAQLRSVQEFALKSLVHFPQDPADAAGVDL